MMKYIFITYFWKKNNPFNMKKIIFAGIISLILLGGFVYSTREVNNQTPKKPIPKLLSAAEMKAKLKKWEATPDGIQYKKWQASLPAKKASYDALRDTE